MQSFEDYLAEQQIHAALFAATMRVSIRKPDVVRNEIEFWCRACEKAVATGTFMIVPEDFGQQPNA